MDTNEIDEKGIEDILARYPWIAASVLSENDESFVLLDRQRKVDSGRTDLLFIVGGRLLLTELKITSAITDHLDQVREYAADLTKTSLADDYIIEPILLAPDIPQEVRDQAVASNNIDVRCVTYDINNILERYQEQLFAGIASFEKPPVLVSVGKLHYIHGVIRELGEAGSLSATELGQRSRVFKDTDHRQPVDRVKKFISLGIRINLLTKSNTDYQLEIESSPRIYDSDMIELTSRGEQYCEAMSELETIWNVMTEQALLIEDLLYEQPHYSRVTNGLLLFLDTVFELSKNSTPVSREAMIDWFPKKVGKDEDWSANSRSRKNAVDWYGSYLNELGLIAKQSNGHYLTPRGRDLISHYYIDVGQELIRFK